MRTVCCITPSQKHLFEEFNIKYRLNLNPKKLPYGDNSCLALISSGILEHVQEEGMTDKEALEEIYRVLKPGGYFFCWNLPRKFALVEFLARLKKTSCHPIKYTPSGIKNILNQTRFSIKYLNYHGDILKIGWFKKLLCKLDPWTALVLDYYTSKLPLLNWFSHHITVMAYKPLS